MKDNNSFLISISLLALSVFLLFYSYKTKVNLIHYRQEAEDKISELENPPEEMRRVSFFNIFSYQIPSTWSILYRYPESGDEHFQLIFNKDLINSVTIGAKEETFLVDVYQDSEIHDDQWGQQEIDQYAEKIDYPDYNKELDNNFGELRFISGNKQIAENNVQAHETYFYKFSFGKDAKSRTYLKIQMTDYNNAFLSENMKDFVMSIEPVIY